MSHVSDNVHWGQEFTAKWIDIDASILFNHTEAKRFLTSFCEYFVLNVKVRNINFFFILAMEICPSCSSHQEYHMQYCKAIILQLKKIFKKYHMYSYMLYAYSLYNCSLSYKPWRMYMTRNNFLCIFQIFKKIYFYWGIVELQYCVNYCYTTKWLNYTHTHTHTHTHIYTTSLVAQTVKRLSTMWETQVRSLGWEDPLEKEMAIHSSTIGWKIPWTEELGRL